MLSCHKIDFSGDHEIIAHGKPSDRDLFHGYSLQGATSTLTHGLGLCNLVITVVKESKRM